jgi:hypothetical protein
MKAQVFMIALWLMLLVIVPTLFDILVSNL